MPYKSYEQWKTVEPIEKWNKKQTNGKKKKLKKIQDMHLLYDLIIQHELGMANAL